jgi:hypothetical protein
LNEAVSCGFTAMGMAESNTHLNYGFQPCTTLKELLMGICERGPEARTEAVVLKDAELGEALLDILRDMKVPVAPDAWDMKLCVTVGFAKKLRRGIIGTPEKPGTKVDGGGTAAEGRAAEEIAYTAFAGRDGLERWARLGIKPFGARCKLEQVKFHFGRTKEGELAVLRVEAEALPYEAVQSAAA